MAREHRGDEPTPVDPTPLGDLLFGRPSETPAQDETQVFRRPPSAEETQVVPAPSPGRPPTGPADAPGPPARAEEPPTDNLPDDWWGQETPATPPPTPTPSRPAPVAPAAPARPVPAAPTHSAPLPRIPDDSPRRGRSLGVALLLVGALAAGALIALGVLYLMDRDPGVAHSPTQSTAPTQEQPTQEQPPAEEEPTTSPTTAERTGELPSGATACGGAKDGLSAGRTNDVTSCPFAEAVRDAYLAGDPGADGSATLTVRSPVTSRTYTMRCTGDVVTTCTGGDNASVVLY